MATFIPLLEAISDQLSAKSRRKRRAKEKKSRKRVAKEKEKVKDVFFLQKLISHLHADRSLFCWPFKSGEYLSNVEA